ncbi:hypothetical protein Bbelb_382350 [Branchiostoma belcheri]|nr:hypothetical protein Bbelb_382350 [Branchiostoma belcheri]
MERILQHMLLIFLLIILKEPNMLEADCSASCSPSLCNCANFHLTSIPQNLPKTISILGLKNNQITTISQSEFASADQKIPHPVDTTFASLPVDTNKPESTSSHDNSSHESAPRFPLSVVIGTASGSVSGICLIGIIIFTTWCKRRARNLPSDPNTKVASGARNLPTAPQLAPPQSNPMYNIVVETRPNNPTSNEGTEPEKPAESTAHGSIPGGPIPPHSQHDDTLPVDSEPHLYEDVDQITRNPKAKNTVTPKQSAKSTPEGSIPPHSQTEHALPAVSEPNQYTYIDMGPPSKKPTPKGYQSLENKAEGDITFIVFNWFEISFPSEDCRILSNRYMYPLGIKSYCLQGQQP